MISKLLKDQNQAINRQCVKKKLLLYILDYEYTNTVTCTLFKTTEARPSEGFTTDSEVSSSEISKDRDDELEIEFEIPGGIVEEGGQKPKFITPANIVEVKEGEEAKLSVKVLGQPLPEVSLFPFSV